MRILLAFASVVLFAAELFGIDAVWKNTATTAQDWFTASNWKDAVTGEELIEPPTNSTDTASFPEIDTTVRTVNLLPKGKNVSSSLGSLSGTAKWKMLLTGANQTFGRYTRSLTVADISGYDGEWSSEGTRQTLKLTAVSGEQGLATVRPNYQFPVEVVNAGVTAVIDRVRGTTGALAKEGAGKMRVKTVYDAPLQLQVNAGEVQIDGVIGEDDPVFDKAFVRLDASKADSLLKFEDDKGRTRVTNWLNCAKNGTVDAMWWDNSASQTKSYVKHIGVPFLAESASGTGLPMLDFGYVAGTTSTPDEDLPYTDEPTNCVMKFTSRMTNIREVFAVFDHSEGRGTSTGVLGDSTDYAFSCNQYDCFKNPKTYPAVFDGEVYYNNSGVRQFPGSDDRINWPFDQYSPSWSDLTLLNLKAAGTLNVHYLASDRLYKGSSGGMRIGEVILFTNALTSVERRDLSEYLMKKWFGAYPKKEFKLVHAADGAALSVPAGKTAKIGTVSARGTLVKRGAGTLEISHLYPPDAKISVEEGAVRIVNDKPTISADGPAGTPQFWYDANAQDAFGYDEEGRIVEWHDCREEYKTARQATRLYEEGKVTEYPIADTTSVAGRTVLEFPSKSAFSMPGTIGGGYAFQREVLMVFTFTTATAAKAYNHIGAGGYTTDRGAYAFYNPSTADDAIGGGVYTINGVATDPFKPDDGTTFKPGTWYVVSAAFNAAINVGRIASIASRGSTGNIKIGEIITYGGALTDDERRNTTAYLMKKWLGKEHPSVVVEPTPSMEFGADTPVVIAADGDLTYQSVSGGDGSIEKTGSGAATVVAPLDDGFASFDVRGGSLTIAKEGYVDKSAFHFDAMNEDSLTTFTVDDGEDGVQTNVAVWADTRANGIQATKPGKNSYMNYTNAVLRTYEMRSGIFRPALDFLKRFSRSDDNKAGTYLPGAALNISARSTKVREAHVVFSDNVDEGSNVIFGDTTDVQFNRGDNRHLFASAVDAAGTKAWPCVLEGGIWLDNEPASASTSLPEGFHLVSITPTDNVSIGMIASERSITGGGNMQAELIAFTEQQTEAERGYLMGSLMHKWFGAAKPVWTNQVPISSLSVAAGSALNVSGDLALDVTSVSGSGTVAADLVNVSELELESADGAPVPLTVDGDIGFADEVTVTLGEGLRRLPAGEYVLMNVTGAIANVRPANWTVVSDVNPNKGLSVKVVGKAIVLEVRAPGLLLLVR